ncbi:Alpha/Beta hydrolase protein [Halteromyces radiatus]|uniref:Alpha/Beta hydrolase protein n=1 Tax=Halteromyces radiatus TaxID=101107 RepID=UPI00221F8C94|nr:Alpha/Beta hydrolase protein [Halteromyces radiatus]KAI8097683.1 Alpha/Beta hydrolase protein [Halteromyces radiatus]
MTIETIAEEFSSLKEKGYVSVAKDRDSQPLNMYYEIHGSGIEKVVLVMGLSTPCQAWEHQCKYLAETGKYTVIIFDNRGVGNSDSPSGLYATSQMAKDAFDLLDHFGWTSGIHLVGISMGGMIALEMATTEPERLKTLTLTSTCARKLIPTVRAVTSLARSAFILKTIEERVDSMVSLVYPPTWLEQTCTEDESYPTNRHMVKARVQRRSTKTRIQPLHGNIGQTAACLRHYVSDARLTQFRKTGIPTMIITGTWDYLVRPDYSYQMHKVLDCRLEVFEGGGHGLIEEQKEKYNALLAEHFSQTSQ